MAISDISALRIDGVHTDCVITPYGDRVMVIVSQTGTMGTLVRNSREKQTYNIELGCV